MKDGVPISRRSYDSTPFFCRANNIPPDIPPEIARLSAPSGVRMCVNRCQLSAEALASFAFQLAPCALELDGVLPLHRGLLDHLASIDDAPTRASCFQRYMRAHFFLNDPPALGWSEGKRVDRSRLDYLRLMRGWLFDAEGREAAILKGWVESRCGLLTQFHRGPIGAADTPSRLQFETELGSALYATSALAQQLDLLYTFAQHELARSAEGAHEGTQHRRLYRGYCGQQALQPLATLPSGEMLVLLNNLSSFSASKERADEFGDYVVACEIPLAKILAYSHLLPGRWQGEEEYLVIGGVVAVRQV